MRTPASSDLPRLPVLLLILVGIGANACTQAPTSSSATTSQVAPATGSASSQQGEVHFTGVIAEVNGRPIYRAFYEQSLTFIRNRLPAGQAEANLERYLNARFDALERLVDDELIYQQAQKEDLIASEEEVQAEVRRASQVRGGKERFLAAMRVQGISEWEAVEGIRRRLSIDRYLRERLTLSIDASEEELLAYYNANIAKFTPDLWVKVFHILIQCPRDADAATAERARQRAVQILANIRAGQSFEAMAREFSEDASAVLGGNMGLVKRGVIYPELDAVAFSITPGQISDVIRTDAGFHIVKVAERRGGTPKPYAAVQEECRKGVLTAKQARAIQELTARLRQSADITSYLD